MQPVNQGNSFSANMLQAGRINKFVRGHAVGLSLITLALVCYQSVVSIKNRLYLAMEIEKKRTFLIPNHDVIINQIVFMLEFTKDMIDKLLTKKEAIQCSGKIYSEEHRRKFDIRGDVFKVERNPTDDNKLILS